MKNAAKHLILSLTLAFISNLHGLNAEKFIVFGDSLSDNGNACLHAEKKDFACNFYPNGRFTDGDVWIEVLADIMRVERPQPSLGHIKGTNFACGGAITGSDYSEKRLNVGTQIDDYLSRTNGYASPYHLHVIWVGGNDLKNKLLPKNILSDHTKFLTNTQEHIIRLAEAGATQFLVPNFPPIDKSPAAELLLKAPGKGIDWLTRKLGLTDKDSNFGSTISGLINDFTQFGIEFYNDELEIILTNLENEYNIKIYRFDTHKHFHHTRENLRNYGVKEELDLYMFDGFHPNAQGHWLIAEAVYKAIKEQE